VSDSFGDFFKQQQAENERRQFRMAMENARNTMRAVRIMIQEGEYDEAERAIAEALGESEG
jgi:hypothetical protein